MTELLDSLNATDKEGFKKSLEDLINQTYVIEEEYKNLNESYSSLQAFLTQIVETLPNAIWVVEDDNSLFLQNSEAQKLGFLFEKLDPNLQSYELDFENKTYLIKTALQGGKKVISATDITGEKRKERLASMGQVAAHLAHEIRNPIGSISLLSSTLLKKVDEKTKPIVSEMKKAIWRVERIIKSTLLFSKGIYTTPSAFYLDEIKDDIFEALGLYSYTKNIALHVELPHVVYQGDKNLLCMVFQNMLFNAIDAIEEDDEESGVIEVCYKNETDFHHIIFKDSGVPIENKDILFEPFKSTKTKGNGLGLSLCLQIVQAHCGEIEAQMSPKAFVVKLKI